MSMHKSGRNDNVTPGASLDLYNGMSGRKEDITLADYIHRKTRHDAFDAVNAEKKLTFDEWLLWYIGMPFEDWDNNLQEDDMRACWKAAQENKA